MIEIEGPDGVIYEFPEGTSEDVMRQALMQVYGGEAQNSISGLAGQFGAGSQHGIAQILGMPVDAIAGALSGAGELTGLWGPIENPFGGSASIAAALEPFRAGIQDPATDAERFSRRVGQEVGAGVAGFPLAMLSPIARSAPAATAAVEGASVLGSGLGAATAEYAFPGNPYAEIAGALLGGIPAGMAASRAIGAGPQAADVIGGNQQFQRQRAADAYDIVRRDQSRIPVADTEALGFDIADRMVRERMRPELAPASSAIAKVLVDDLIPDPTLIGPTRGLRVEDLEDLRRIAQRSVPATAAPDDRRLAEIMKNEITDFLDNLNTPATEALREGRDATRRYKAAEMVQQATERAERRAASSGSGGNEINAIRQNLRALLDNPNRARSFTASERAAMEEIVRGSTDQNLMRRLSRFAPSSGGLASMLGIGGAIASPAVTIPVVGITEGAKILGERSTQRAVDQLVRSLLGERVVSPGTPGVDSVARALLGARIVSED